MKGERGGTRVGQRDGKRASEKRERKGWSGSWSFHLVLLHEAVVSVGGGGGGGRQAESSSFVSPAKQNRQGSRAYAQSHMSCRPGLMAF